MTYILPYCTYTYGTVAIAKHPDPQLLNHFRMTACCATRLPVGAALEHSTLCVAGQLRLALLVHF